MEIYFLRHASAGEAKLSPTKDNERELDEVGVKQSHDVGCALASLEVRIDIIVSSPLPRAAQTAAIVAKEIGYKDEIASDTALRPEGSYEQFQDLLRHHSDTESIMLVGHNPSMTEFLNRLLLGENAPDAIELKKAAIAKVEKAGRGPAVLKWYVTPKVVRSIQQAAAKSSRPKTVSK
jgi:phosphohistidine phosphatase